MDLSKLDTSLESVSESVEHHARQLCPWLPDPHRCDECGIYCEADVVYDYRMFEPTEAWTCPECQQSFYRDEPWHDA